MSAPASCCSYLLDVRSRQLLFAIHALVSIKTVQMQPILGGFAAGKALRPLVPMCDQLAGEFVDHHRRLLGSLQELVRSGGTGGLHAHEPMVYVDIAIVGCIVV